MTRERCCLGQMVIFFLTQYTSIRSTNSLPVCCELTSHRTRKPHEIRCAVSISLVFITKGIVCTIHHFEENSSQAIPQKATYVIIYNEFH